MSIFEVRSFLGLARYYRRFENGMKLSIWGRIVGFRLLDMDSIVEAALTIEREIEDTWNTRDMGVGKKERINFLLVRRRGRRLLLHTSFKTRARIGMSDGISPEIGIPRVWDNAVPVSCRTGEYTVHSSTP